VDEDTSNRGIWDPVAGSSTVNTVAYFQNTFQVNGGRERIK